MSYHVIAMSLYHSIPILHAPNILLHAATLHANLKINYSKIIKIKHYGTCMHNSYVTRHEKTGLTQLHCKNNLVMFTNFSFTTMVASGLLSDVH